MTIYHIRVDIGQTASGRRILIRDGLQFVGNQTDFAFGMSRCPNIYQIVYSYPKNIIVIITIKRLTRSVSRRPFWSYAQMRSKNSCFINIQIYTDCPYLTDTYKRTVYTRQRLLLILYAVHRVGPCGYKSIAFRFAWTFDSLLPCVY